MTRKLLLGLALVCGAAAAPVTAMADHGHSSFRFDIGSIIGGPVYEAQPVQVWVEPVYQTVVQRVWVPEVTQTAVDRVWIPEHYEWRDTHDRWHRVIRQQVLMSGYYADQPRTVVVTPGHYEDQPTQQLVAAGHWETRYQETPRPQFGLDLEFRR